jgi:hypothetical protein
MNHIEAMRIALETLENAPIEYDFHGNPMDAEFGKQLDAAVQALLQALEQPDVIDAAVLSEREACAKVCEVEASVIVTNASEQYQEGRAMGATVCAAAIRARGE